MIFQEEYREKLKPSDMSFIILNNLHEFNNKPECILDIIKKMDIAKDHPIHMHYDFYSKAYNDYFVKHNKFPDIKWLDVILPSKNIKIIEGEVFSISIYEDFVEILEQAVIKAETQKYVVDRDQLSIDDCQRVIKQLSRYIDKSNEKQLDINKDFLVNLYEVYSENFSGIKTHLAGLDDLIGVLGYKSISVIGGPSGHGKSTLALSIAYNVAVFGGHCVDYITFELPFEHLWINLVSIESLYLGYNLPAHDIKEALLTEEQKEQYKECTLSLMAKLNASGGYINVMDVTTLSTDTYEGLKGRLESTAEKRGRGADLVVIDNIDGFKSFKSSEKDTDKKVDNMVLDMDSYSKTYYNGKGTSILLLTQLNNAGVFKLDNADNTKDGTNASKKQKKVVIDGTVYRQYSSMMHRGTVCLVAYANERMRGMRKMRIYPVKIRNRAVPETPLELSADFRYSRIGGDVYIPTVTADNYATVIKRRESEGEEDDYQ